MSVILIVTWDGGGNVPPALGIAAELVARGDAVTILGHPRQRAAIEATGADALVLDHTAGWDPGVRRSTARFAAAYLALFTDRGIGSDTTAAIARVRPDVILVDALLPAATAAALASRRPTIVLVHTVLAAVHDMAKGPIGAVSSVKGFSMARGLAAASTLIVTSPEQLAVAPTPANAVHVGPVFGPGAAAPAATDAASRRVLVSLSTIHYAGMARVLQSLVDVLGEVPVEAIVTTGPTIDPDAIVAPPRIVVRRFVPHAEILADAALVIGHGGHGTATSALAAGIPVVVRPMSGLGDHQQVAAALEHADVGSRLPRNGSRAVLAAHITSAVDDVRLRKRAGALGAVIRSGAGAQAAADILERAAR